MPIMAKILSCRTKQGLQVLRTLTKEVKQCSSTSTSTAKQNTEMKNTNYKTTEKASTTDANNRTVSLEYRFIYPEFLPDPNPLHRNSLREKLERMDMLSRRVHIDIPEFYVGSILAVSYSEPHAPGKTNRFVGICISREGCGLRASFTLRNVVDKQGVEVIFNLYDPAIQKIDCLRCEKRLDAELLYLRDAPLEYSTFPFDMNPEILPEGSPIPVNKIQVPLNPPPWLQRWERKELKGATNISVNEKRIRKAAARKKPWEKYDLMKTYRETIPEEDQHEIFSEVQPKLKELEISQRRMRRRRISSQAPKNT